MVLLAQVLTARGRWRCNSSFVGLQEISGNSPATEPRKPGQERVQCREVSGEPAGAGAGWVKMTCAMLRDDMRRNVNVRGLFLLIDPSTQQEGALLCIASQGH